MANTIVQTGVKLFTGAASAYEARQSEVPKPSDTIIHTEAPKTFLIVPPLRFGGTEWIHWLAEESRSVCSR